MRKAIVLLLSTICIASVTFSEETTNAKEFPHYGLQGWVTVVRPDMLSDLLSPDVLNIETARYTGLITRRLGSSLYLTTPLEGAKFIRNSYVYRQVDNDEYILLQSSTSMFYSTGDGNSTKIRSDLNSTSVANITTARDTAYIVDGTTWAWSFNGTTTTILDNKVHGSVTISTNVPSYPYFVKWWHNRLWYFRTDTYPSTVWYSNYNDPEVIGDNSTKNINVSDGDYITGAFLYQNRLFVTKRNSTWEITEIIDDSSDPFFIINSISQVIGCLYQNTMREHQGFPTWLSHRGVEIYNGQFNLASEPIDPYVKALNQLTSASRLSLTQDTASDWGKGSGINIDTTTTLGSVGIKAKDSSRDQSQLMYRHQGSLDGGYSRRQSFKPSYTGYVDKVNVDMTTFTGGDGTFNVYIASNNMNIMESYTLTVSSVTGDNTDINFNHLKLTKDNTYYIVLSSVSGAGQVLVGYHEDRYNRGNMATKIYDGAWTEAPAYDLTFAVYMSTMNPLNGTYTSQTLNAGTSWGSWGNFTADETKPSGGTIVYYGQGGGSTTTASVAVKTVLTNGSPINISTGPYIVVTSSLSRTSSTVNPLVNSIGISYNTSSALKQPFAIDYNDNYMIAVSTNTSNNDNNVVLVLQSNGEWTRFNGSGMNWGSTFVYKNNLYSCDSKDTGKVYRQDVENSYSDDGTGYESYYCSKIFNFGSIRETTILDIAPLFNDEGDWNVNIDYRMHGSEGSWTTKTLNLSDDTFGLITKVMPLQFPKSYFFQYRISETDIDQSFEYRGMTIRYLIESLK